MYQITPPPPPPRAFLLRLTDLNSVKAEIDMIKLLFLGSLVTDSKLAPSVKNLLRSRSESLCYQAGVKLIKLVFLPSIWEALCKYDLFIFFEICFNRSSFPAYCN